MTVTFNLSQTGPVVTANVEPGVEAPVIIRPEHGGDDLCTWARANREQIDSLLVRHGAILFRGFDIDSISGFGEFARATSDSLMDYSDPSTSRAELASRIYTSTEYPATEIIPLHNEMSYSNTWPLKIWFYCETPARMGGQTPIGDSRKVLELISPRTRQRFLEKGVMYVRNYGDGIGLGWQTAFGTTSKQAVEDYCSQNRIEYEWRSGGRLRTRQVRPATARHPKTGATVWFNQAHIHHISSLAPDLREALLTMVESKEFPLDINSLYGDGSPIEPSELEELRNAYKQVTVAFVWQKGDIMMLDNMLTAHGRSPFVGPRRVLVTMGEPVSQ